MPVITELAHHMGLVPLAWLAVTRQRQAASWWLAGAFGISWVADSLAHWVEPWLVSAVYPVSQAAIVGAVLLLRRDARVFLVALVAVGVAAVLTLGIEDSTVFLRSVAWLGIVGIVWPLPLGRLRTALLVAFGLGWLAWIGYTLWPGWGSWGVYQSVRAVSLGLFCWAHVAPVLRLAR